MWVLTLTCCCLDLSRGEISQERCTCVEFLFRFAHAGMVIWRVFQTYILAKCTADPRRNILGKDKYLCTSYIPGIVELATCGTLFGSKTLTFSEPLGNCTAVNFHLVSCSRAA